MPKCLVSKAGLLIFQLKGVIVAALLPAIGKQDVLLVKSPVQIVQEVRMV